MVTLFIRRHWRVLLVAAALLFNPSRTWAQEFVFTNSLAAGKTQAAQADKLLVVIHSTNDFTQPPFTLPDTRTFHRLTLQDPLVASASRDRCVFVCQPIGNPELAVSAADRGKQADRPRNENVVTYFCSADGHVLHLLTGFIGSEELVSGLAWAERIQRESQLKATVAERSGVIAGWHQVRIADPRAVALLSQALKKKPEPAGGGELSSHELRAFVAASWAIRNQQLLARFGNNFAERDRPALLQELAQHGEPRTDFPHLILARQPLIPLPRLQRQIAEVCLQSEFWELSPRREEVAEWFATQRRQRKPILLVVASNTDADLVASRSIADGTWRVPTELLVTLVGRTAVAHITRSELVTLWLDLKLDPQFLARRKAPQFVIIDGAGAVRSVLDEKSDNGALARDLARGIDRPFVAGKDTKSGAIPPDGIPPDGKPESK